MTWWWVKCKRLINEKSLIIWINFFKISNLMFKRFKPLENKKVKCKLNSRNSKDSWVKLNLLSFEIKKESWLTVYLFNH
jgi:hypothetical protein